MSQALAFIKMQGVGNDFVLVDARGGPKHEWPSLARRLCDRHFGVGADGLLLVTQEEGADVGMRMFNPDGTEDFCGNGLRCVARYVADGQPQRRNLSIATIAGLRAARILDDGQVQVEMQQPAFHPSDIPMLVEGDRVVDYDLPLEGGPIRITALSTGSTHAVAFVDDLPDDETFLRISPLVENHPFFPERTSVMWTRVSDRHSIRLRIWERGAGETLGCGTGACAAMAAARVQGLVDSEVTVSSRGGEVMVQWEPGGKLLKTGPAEYVFEGRFIW